MGEIASLSIHKLHRIHLKLGAKGLIVLLVVEPTHLKNIFRVTRPFWIMKPQVSG